MIKYLPPVDPQFDEYIRGLYPENFSGINDIKTITFQVTENCCLNCSYCYQVHATNFDMDFSLIKNFLDDLFDDKFEKITTKNTRGIIWEFIGGEPFMKIKLISQITDYMFTKMITLKHPWLFFCKISISTNGILYFEEDVQNYLDKYSSYISLGISLDGNKQLHDSCRVDLNGEGSYDRVISAVRDFKRKTGSMPNAKLTFSHDNIKYLYESFQSLVKEGYIYIPGNCVYEDVWKDEDPTILYNELKKVADYLVDNNLYNIINFSMFDENMFTPMEESDNDNWCGGVGCTMIAIDSKGDIYHCIRYMKSSLNGEQKPLTIGNIKNGIAVLPEHKEAYDRTSKAEITRRSQSTDECFYCPIAKGCAWCSAYNYQKNGTVNKRVTFICGMHKARALANVYFWNRVYKKVGVNKKFKLYLPDKECLKIISQSELILLKRGSE